jgi:hypothetical protein
MSIVFRCEHCHKEVKAPDAAGGRRGRCPYCGQNSYIPAPVSEEDLLPLAPVDEQEEARRRREVEMLMQAERALLVESGSSPEPASPAGGAAGAAVTAEQLYHHVVNYVLDMSRGNLERAALSVQKLKKGGWAGHEAVADFQNGKAVEEVLKSLPTRVLQGYLSQLKTELG